MSRARTAAAETGTLFLTSGEENPTTLNFLPDTHIVVIRAKDIDHALSVGKECELGNGASIFTRSGWTAREFKRHFNAGMIAAARRHGRRWDRSPRR